MPRKPPLSRVRPGDTVTCNVRGRIFAARVRDVDIEAGKVVLDPPPGVGYYVVTWRQVTTHARWTPSDAIVTKED